MGSWPELCMTHSQHIPLEQLDIATTPRLHYYIPWAWNSLGTRPWLCVIDRLTTRIASTYVRGVPVPEPYYCWVASSSTLGVKKLFSFFCLLQNSGTGLDARTLGRLAIDLKWYKIPWVTHGTLFKSPFPWVSHGTELSHQNPRESTVCRSKKINALTFPAA